jgi:phosphoribosylanthranilate isomerase
MRSVTRIKVSGVTDPDDARLAVELGADLVACVFVAASPRYVTLPRARLVRAALPHGAVLVGIFADAPAALVRSLATHIGLDQVQLFGSEPRSMVERMRPYAFKAVTLREPSDLDSAVRSYIGRRPKPDMEQPGLLLHLAAELGQEWDLVADACSRTPTLLASSQLTATNVTTALQVAQPWGIDVWDAVESEPGRLDRGKLEELIAAVRETSF